MRAAPRCWHRRSKVEQVSHGVFVVGPGSLFPALHRLADNGWIVGEWSETENKRRVKTYTLTAAGRTRSWWMKNAIGKRFSQQ